MATKKKSKPVKAKAAGKPKMPTASSLAETLGVKLTKRLTVDQIRRLRRPLPGYVSLLDDAAQQLEEDRALLNLSDVTPAALLAAHAEQKDIAAREAVAEIVYQSVYEQRQVVDDRAMGMLQKLARRVAALTEDDPSLPGRWKFLRDFLAEFRPGAGKKAQPANPTPGDSTPSAAASG